MESENTDVIDIRPIDILSQHESIHESNHELSWISSAEAKHRLHTLSNSAFTRAISDLFEVHKIPSKYLRRGNGKKTEYSKFAIAAIKCMGNAGEIEKLKSQYLGKTEEEETCLVPAKYKRDADREIQITNSRIEIAKETASSRLTQLRELHSQWVQAENAEKAAREKEKEHREAEWELQCIEEVIAEESFKRSRKRELKQMLRNSSSPN